MIWALHNKNIGAFHRRPLFRKQTTETLRMYLLRAASVVTLLCLILEISESKKCHLSKDVMFPRNIKLNLNFSSINQLYVSGGEINVDSLSPWNYRIDKDDNRFPVIIAEAVCLHKQCRDADGKEDPAMYSLPIKHEILVLRRENKNCQQNFWLDTQMVTVGCTCSKPNYIP